MQARWPRDQVRIMGDATEYVRIADEGEDRSFFFCPRCGATVYYGTDPEYVAVPVGAFADPNFPAPRVSGWENRMPRGWACPTGSSTSASRTSGVGGCSQVTRNVSVVRAAEPPSVARSPMVSRLPWPSLRGRPTTAYGASPRGARGRTDAGAVAVLMVESSTAESCSGVWPGVMVGSP